MIKKMTITEKILARASGKIFVEPGENIWLNVDILMTHDVCGPPMIKIWEKEFGEKRHIWDKNKVVIIPDHYIFTSNPEAKRNIEILREFARENKLQHFYDVGGQRYKGVCHIALAEEGFDIPGIVLIGTDSHTCTAGAFSLFATGVGNTDAAFILGTGKIWEKVPASIKIALNGNVPIYLTAKDIILKILGELGIDGASYCAIEFTGDSLAQLNMDERLTLTNMTVEMGAMSGIIACDEITKNYLAEKGIFNYEEFKSDDGADYYQQYSYDVSKIEPIVAKPHSPDNIALARELSGVKVSRCYIGSCTGGKLNDMKAAAKILKGNKVKVPTYIVPATSEISMKLKEEKEDGMTLLDIFEKAGCIVAKPSCAACLGGPKDTVGRAEDNDVVISSTNRNFPGRMGSKTACVYLASPLTVAASAISQHIADPREFI
jgi:3-isopropylmalate/(R)-2-methylmalate dehydratase large subunit